MSDLGQRPVLDFNDYIAFLNELSRKLKESRSHEVMMCDECAGWGELRHIQCTACDGKGYYVY